MSVDVDKRRFTADEYHRMGAAGILCKDDRVELIEGEILTMTPIDPPHAAAINRAARALILAAGANAIVTVQNPIRLNTFNEPQPDLALVRPRDDFYRSAHPQPPDVLLVIEIADTTLRYDRELKAPLYARNNIVEYWLVDLSGGNVTCYSRPANGVYHEVTMHSSGEVLTPTQLTICKISVDDLLTH